MRISHGKLNWYVQDKTFSNSGSYTMQFLIHIFKETLIYS